MGHVRIVLPLTPTSQAVKAHSISVYASTLFLVGLIARLCHTLNPKHNYLNPIAEALKVNLES